MILVVLASLATVNILSAQKSARLKTAKLQIELLDHACDHYQLDIGSYPSNLQSLRFRPNDIPDPAKWEGPYLSKDVPVDPWNNQYQYMPQGQHNQGKPDIWTVSMDNNQTIGNWEDEKR